MENLLKLSQFSNGELTKLRRRQQRQRQKAIVLVSKKNNSARASHFFVHSFAVPARLSREMTKSYYYYYYYYYYFFFFFFEDGNGKAINSIIAVCTRVRPLSSAPTEIPFFQVTG